MRSRWESARIAKRARVRKACSELKGKVARPSDLLPVSLGKYRVSCCAGVVVYNGGGPLQTNKEPLCKRVAIIERLSLQRTPRIARYRVSMAGIFPCAEGNGSSAMRERHN